MNKQLLEDKVIVLIGAGDGLGKVFAEEFSSEGATVVMVARSEDKLKAAAQEIADKDGNVLPVVGDYASMDDAKRVFKTAIDTYGKVDVLVTNASKTGLCQSIEVVEDELVHQIIDTDVKGLIWYNREAMKHFIERDSGNIINIGSNNVGRPVCDTVYCAAKYAAWGLTKQLAMRCVGTGIRCNLLNPGSFASTAASALSSEGHMYDGNEKVQASGRIPVENGSMFDIMKARTNRAVPVDLHQVAYAAVYLASDLSRHVNGQCFTVDRGGYL